MTKYIANKIATAIVLILLVSFLVFILMQQLPGDPATIALGDSASAEAIQQYRDSYGLNEPVLVLDHQHFHQVEFRQVHPERQGCDDLHQ